MVGGVAASREWTIRAWRISTGPRTNALSSEASGQYAGGEKAGQVDAVVSRSSANVSSPQAAGG